MRFTSVVPFLLAASPALAAVKPGTLGFALGNKNPDGTCKSTDDYKKDFEHLKDLTSIVRTYSAKDCSTAQNIIPAAKDKGFKVVLGVW